MSIVTLAELKEYLDDTGSSDDGLLTSILAGVCARVESYTGRVFHPIPALDSQGADTLPAVTKRVRLPRAPDTLGSVALLHSVLPSPRTIQIPDVREVDQVVFAGGANVGAYELEGDAPWRSMTLFSIAYDVSLTAVPAVLITGRFGLWPAPDDVKDAVKAMAARRYKERDAGYADSVLLQDGATVNYFRQFSPTVQATLEAYRRRSRLR